MEALEIFNVDDKTVEIHYDEDAPNPRDPDYQDNCDMFILFHPRYNLGDNHNYKRDCDWDEMEKRMERDLKPVEIRRIRMYDHSGTSISDGNEYPYNDRWDSMMIGFALITREAALREMSAKKVTKKVKDWAKNYLTATIKEYNNYLTGQVFGYVVKDNDDNTLDSCWGFNGDIEYVRKEATNAAKAITIPPKPEVKDPNQLELAFT